MTRIAGLIGGMSWQTTALYYSEINKHIATKLGGQHSADLLLRSLDYDVVARAVSKADFVALTRVLVSAGRELQAAGAEGLVLCANVAHKATDTIERDTGLPVLHIADFTGCEIVQSKLKRVGLLATRAVMEEEFYKARLKDKFGLDVVVPSSKEFRDNADRQIFQEMSKALIAQNVREAWRKAYNTLVEEDGVDCIILACTELRLVFQKQDMRVPTFDTAMLHARGVADWMTNGQVADRG